MGDSSFTGKSMTYGKGKGEWSKDRSLEDMKKEYGDQTEAIRWRNRRPICPYGCGEEGQLLEIMMQDEKTIGIYTHSTSVKPFTSDLQMAPKPTGRKLAIGPDGEYTMVEDTGGQS